MYKSLEIGNRVKIRRHFLGVITQIGNENKNYFIIPNGPVFLHAIKKVFFILIRDTHFQFHPYFTIQNLFLNIISLTSMIHINYTKLH